MPGRPSCCFGNVVVGACAATVFSARRVGAIGKKMYALFGKLCGVEIAATSSKIHVMKISFLA